MKVGDGIPKGEPTSTPGGTARDPDSDVRDWLRRGRARASRHDLAAYRWRSPGRRPFALGKKGEEALSRPERPGGARQTVGPDGRGRVRDRGEGDLGESRRSEPLSNRRREVRREPSPRPDHGRMRRAELGKMLDGVPYIRVGDVSEDSAYQHDVGRYLSRVRIGGRGISEHEFDPGEPVTHHLLASCGDELGSQFDQACVHVAPAGMARADPQEISPVSGTHADDPDGARGAPIQSLPDEIAYDL